MSRACHLIDQKLNKFMLILSAEQDMNLRYRYFNVELHPISSKKFFELCIQLCVLNFTCFFQHLNLVN